MRSPSCSPAVTSTSPSRTRPRLTLRVATAPRSTTCSRGPSLDSRTADCGTPMPQDRSASIVARAKRPAAVFWLASKAILAWPICVARSMMGGARRTWPSSTVPSLRVTWATCPALISKTCVLGTSTAASMSPSTASVNSGPAWAEVGMPTKAVLLRTRPDAMEWISTGAVPPSGLATVGVALPTTSPVAIGIAGLGQDLADPDNRAR